MKYLPFLALTFLHTFLYAEEGAPAESKSQWQQIIWMVGIAIVLFYFILWRPEQKRRKRMENQIKSLRKGDRVTAMGIVGTISQIKDKTVILKMVDGAKIEMLTDSIRDVESGGGEESQERVDE